MYLSEQISSSTVADDSKIWYKSNVQQRNKIAWVENYSAEIRIDL